MRAVTLQTARLILVQPGEREIDAITTACQDPLFERTMTTPWPYRRSDAEAFVGAVVPEGWADEVEATWALRLRGDQRILGMIGVRGPERGGDLGYWLAREHRGHGYMTEAVRAVLDWVRTTGFIPLPVRWYCVAGNTASARVARAAGFAHTGESTAPWRGDIASTWTGEWGGASVGLRWPAALDA